MLEADGLGSDADAGGQGRTGMERAWMAHMAGLRASYQRHLKQDAAGKDSRIEALLDPKISARRENRTNWEIPNEIEILMVRLKTGPDLDVALDSAFLTAEKIGVPSFAVLKARHEGLASDDQKQALLARLLRDTHNRYAARRSERAERAVVAKRMAWLGLWLTGAVVVVLVVLGMEPSFTLLGVDYKLDYVALAQQNAIVCVFFGVLGAYLSRLIAFQNGAPQLSFDDLENGYARHFIFVRLLVGGLCALVVYFVIAGRLIGGELFPQPEAPASGGFGQLWQEFGSEGYTGPTANFAKLIIWCFIAGFSERFLPDHLSALEAKSKA
jgi:hypothetical protein